MPYWIILLFTIVTTDRVFSVDIILFYCSVVILNLLRSCWRSSSISTVVKHPLRNMGFVLVCWRLSHSKSLLRKKWQYRNLAHHLPFFWFPIVMPISNPLRDSSFILTKNPFVQPSISYDLDFVAEVLSGKMNQVIS